MNGLDISEEQFCKMTAKDRDLVMFKNIKHIRATSKDNPWAIKIGFVWLFILSVTVGFRKYIPL